MTLLSREDDVAVPAASKMQRAPKLGIVEELEARRIARGYLKEISSWRTTTAQMVALAWKLQEQTTREAFCAKANELLQKVQKRLEELEARRSSLPPVLARHPRLEDTCRALQSVQRRLELSKRIAVSGDPDRSGRVPLPDIF